MKITIICIGKIKEKYLLDAISEYKKRISRFLDLNIVELKEYSLLNEDENTISKAKSIETEYINKYIENNTNKFNDKYIILLDIDGEMLSTIEFASEYNNIKNNSISEIIFIIGGSHGIDKNTIKYINKKLSFSKFTFPHQLFRVILLEQIYRILKINNNESYHK